MKIIENIFERFDINLRYPRRRVKIGRKENSYVGIDLLIIFSPGIDRIFCWVDLEISLTDSNVAAEKIYPPVLCVCRKMIATVDSIVDSRTVTEKSFFIVARSCIDLSIIHVLIFRISSIKGVFDTGVESSEL